MSKKELKQQIKAAREAGFQKYISLTIASEDDMRQYLAEYEVWLSKAGEREQIEAQVEEARQQIALEKTQQQEQERQSVIAAVEKKLSASLPLSVVGEQVCAYLNTLADYSASTWSKNGEMRIYLKDISYTNPKDAGYVRVSPDGEIKTNFIRSVSEELHSAIAKLKSLIKISQNDLTATPRRRSPDEIKAAITAGENVDYEEIAGALDAIYGKGKWDDRDREDFEG